MTFLVILNGPAGGGKTTISKLIWKSIPRTALVSLDELNWLVSDYKADTAHLDLARNVGVSMTEIYLDNQKNVVVEKAFCKYQYITPFVKLAEERNSFPLIYNIEAPLDTILARVASRPLNARGERISQEYARKIYYEYQSNKFQVTQTFDTSQLSSDQIVQRIIGDIVK